MLTLLYPSSGEKFIGGFGNDDYSNYIYHRQSVLGICINSEIRNFLGGYRNKNLCPYLLRKPNI
jgi:hypothetical protein